ncbi:hypothetical protein PR202_gb00364 [Eleusine coracana subsp. coracana]|uniref:Uncharacterized protein n=1 Tax=Eleusine coracana subsp. coracana TaxID=191504 RepID=A0AAV5DTQ5_ELECO|nr:hypothetical protein PR202_gb00364 [Eleusine coracana subsp. coracana]
MQGTKHTLCSGCLCVSPSSLLLPTVRLLQAIADAALQLLTFGFGMSLCRSLPSEPFAVPLLAAGDAVLDASSSYYEPLVAAAVEEDKFVGKSDCSSLRSKAGRRSSPRFTRASLLLLVVGHIGMEGDRFVAWRRKAYTPHAPLREADSSARTSFDAIDGDRMSSTDEKGREKSMRQQDPRLKRHSFEDKF